MYLLNLYYVSGVMLLIFSLMSLITGNYLFFKDLSVFYEYEFFSLNSSELVMVLLFDWMSMFFIGVVFMISSMVIFYSQSYMAEDINKNRFLILVLLFVMSMMFMIISPNLISILLGWDGLGLVSYCLVIYYQNVKSYNAGMLTILSNRVGDAAILMAIAWMINYGSWNFFLYQSYMKNDLYMYIIGILVILAGITKSAQIPFSSWLPAAMAAPTPVSALVHSSTLVTAGVYLLIRFSVLMEDSMLFKTLMFLGMLTMFMSGLGANFEFDLKKIIALSTLSQLGLMMMILGAGFSNLAFFHLLTHAFFKSLLFLCAGVLIHSFKDTQDIRSMGNIIKFMPMVSTYFNISNLALCGAPFLAGFYSKDLILEVMFLSNLNFISLFFCFFSTGLTVSYSFRLLYWSFFSNFKLYSLFNLYDEDLTMNKSMFTLMLMSIVVGSLLMWLIMPVMYMIYIPIHLKFMVLYVIFMGLVFSYLFVYVYKLKNWKIWFSFSSFVGGMWFLPMISTYGVNFLILKGGLLMKKSLDFGWLENLIFINVSKNLLGMSSVMQKFHLNFIKMYLMIFVLWIFVLMIMIMI
uniref:NADH-ubiquinone oxidoreductase chain 5 n=1 Tax=Phryganea bipunctata TaxID=1875852 RepID=A0A7D7JVQ8_9NEOP|nr:NADH dehydrogenase subunit 5 [Phryganea bipunctata]QMP96678.1 NADH dehydrogenase subunit 5 [Phryganea bipunctata]